MGTVAVKWIESNFMTGIDSFGQSMTIGWAQDREPRWSGTKPSDLLMLAAASCAAYDVINILEKQKEPMEGLEITCDGKQESEPPYQFTSLHLHFQVKGAVNPKKVERAIHLSEEKYCSVTNTLRHGVEISTSFEVVG